MDTKLEMIEKISKLYRENLKYAEDLRRKKNKIKDTMQNPILTHVEYVKFEIRIKFLEESYTAQLFKSQGISLAREVLLDL